MIDGLIIEISVAEVISIRDLYPFCMWTPMTFCHGLLPVMHQAVQAVDAFEEYQ